MTIPTAEQLAAHSLVQQHAVTKEWSERAQRLRLLAAEHELDVSMATDLDFATARRDRFAPDAPVEIFLNVWEMVAKDLSVMLSMRYEGGDPGRPFVDACALGRAIESSDDVDHVRQVAWDRFGRLGPRYLRWWSREPAGHYPGTQQDKRFLAAPLSRLVAIDVPSQISLQVARDLEHYHEARRAYASVDHEHPRHPDQAHIETLGDLEELRRDGTLFDVLLDGRWCGYVAAERGHKLGLDGYKIAELVLTEDARGHGYGSYLTSLLARALMGRGAARRSVIIGTIHNDNIGARRAAERAGRLDIGGWVRSPFS